MDDCSKLPWYKRRAGLEDEIWTLCLGVEAIRPDEAPLLLEVGATLHQSAVNMVFESNLTENAGLDRGATKLVLEEMFPKIPHSNHSLRARLTGGGHEVEVPERGTIRELLRTYAAQRAAPDGPDMQVRFGERRRGLLEVLHHYVALGEALDAAQRFRVGFSTWLVHNIRHTADAALPEASRPQLQSLRDVLGQLPTAATARRAPRHPTLLNQRAVQRLHREIAAELADPQWGSAPGEYRTKAVNFGDPPLTGVAPGNVGLAMRRFVEQSNRWIRDSTSPFVPDGSPFLVAAQVSHAFVRIHPFPDFNGRIARLLSVMVLHAAGYPFVVSIRGDSKSKQRYRQALQRADRGQGYEALASLLAQNALETLLGLDENLKRIGASGLARLAQRWPPQIRALVHRSSDSSGDEAV